MAYQTVNEILEFAIANEEAAENFYKNLAEKVSHAHIKKAFLDFAAEERGHKAKLQLVKAGETLLNAQAKVNDLKISDYLEEIEMRGDLEYKDALIIAMKAEKAAFRLYSDLAESTTDANLRQLFQGLAQEEAKHKLRFEIEYDEYLYEN
jgi:rubrerythrin